MLAGVVALSLSPPPTAVAHAAESVAATSTTAPSAPATPEPEGDPEPSQNRESSTSPTPTTSPSSPGDTPVEDSPADDQETPESGGGTGGGGTQPPITITSPASDTFVSGTFVTISGSKRVGSAVTIPGLLGAAPLCQVAANSGTTWSCGSTELPSGTIGLTALELVDGVQTSESNELTLRVLGAPAFTSPGPFTNAGSLDGLGWDGASIRVVVSSPMSAVQTCAQKVGDGYWYCGLDPARFGDGTYRVQVQQSWPGSTTEWSPVSAASTLTIDRGIPAAPVITTPTAGQSSRSDAVPFAGTGETGAVVDVYVDDTSVCTVPVVDSAWSCTVERVAAGRHSIKALQVDAAGNVSAPSSSATVRFTGAAASPGPTTSPGTATPTPSTIPGPSGGTTQPGGSDPAPGQSTAPSQAPAPQQGEDGDAGGPDAGAGGDGTVPGDESAQPPFLPPPPGGDSPLPPDQTWGTPTDYGAAILSPSQSVERGTWVDGVLLALGWLLLIALPLRLLAGALRGRLAVRGPRVTGRNRLSTELRLREERLQLSVGNPVFVAGGMLLGAALLAVLASGIQNEVRYLRLSLAVAAGLAVLNLACGFAMRIAGHLNDAGKHLRLVPLFLLVGAVTAIVSRAAGIQPPLIVGILIGFKFAMGVPARARGILQLTQIAVMTVLAVGAWILLGLLGPVEGFWPSAVSEVLSVICLAGLGSALLLLLPVLALPGRAILEWSPLLWAATTLVVGSLAAIVLTGEHFPVLLFAAVAAAVAAVSVAIWGWTRFVQPTIAR